MLILISVKACNYHELSVLQTPPPTWLFTKASDCKYSVLFILRVMISLTNHGYP